MEPTVTEIKTTIRNCKANARHALEQGDLYRAGYEMREAIRFEGKLVAARFDSISASMAAIAKPDVATVK